jgi:hypothetical protein
MFILTGMPGKRNGHFKKIESDRNNNPLDEPDFIPLSFLFSRHAGTGMRRGG